MAGDSAEPSRRTSGSRRIAIFALTFALSLVIGKVFETVSSCETMVAVGKWQQRWYASVYSMAPVAMTTDYLRDVLYVAETGDLSLQPAAVPARAVPVPLRGCGVLCDTTESANPPVSAPPITLSAAGTRTPAPGWVSPTIDIAGSPHVEGGGSPHLLGILAAPFAGLAMTFGRLVEPGGMAYVWGILQLGVGFLLWLFLRATIFSDDSRRGIWPENLWGWFVGLPVGTVICASAAAFVMKYAMLWGLAAFGWFTCFAAAACVASGIAGTCWFFAVKLAEHAAQERASL